MDKNPKVSVVIPTYNSAQFIVETLESVFAQTYKDYEVIVVDDGSTDNTKEVLKPYMSRIRYIYKENGGPASARNEGIKNARGEYIAFLDSDDLWLPEKLEKQVEYFEQYPDVVLVSTDRIRLVGNRLIRGRKKCKRVSNDAFINLWWCNSIVNSSVMVRRFCFDKVGVFDESEEIISAEDLEMWLRIAREHKVGYIDQALTIYRVHKDGISRSNVNRVYKATRVVITKYMKDIIEREQNFRKLITERFFKYYLDYGISLFYAADFPSAHKQFSEARRYKKFNIKASFSYLITSLDERSVKKLRHFRKSFCTIWSQLKL